MNLETFPNEVLDGLKERFMGELIEVSFSEKTPLGKGPGYLLSKKGYADKSFCFTFYLSELVMSYLAGNEVDQICDEIADFVKANIDKFSNAIMDNAFENINPENFIVMGMSKSDPRFSEDSIHLDLSDNAAIVLYTMAHMDDGHIMCAPVLNSMYDLQTAEDVSEMFTQAMIRTIDHTKIEYTSTTSKGVWLTRDVNDFADGYYLTFAPFLDDMCDIMEDDHFYILPVSKTLALLFTDEGANAVKTEVTALFSDGQVQEEDFYINGVFHYDKTSQLLTQQK